MAKKKVQEVVVHMAGLNPSITDDANLDAMLAGLDADEIIEENHSEEVIEAAVADIEKVEAVQALYKEAENEPAIAVADTPQDVAEKPVKAKKAKVAKEPKAPKAPRVTSVTHLPGDRLLALLGDTGFLTFSMSDDATTQLARAESFVTAMNTKGAIADKVKEKAIMLMTWIKSGKDVSALNDVMRRAFTVLIADGELTSGKAGNLQANLLSKPYSAGTSASQANQMFMLFPLLGITQREKGRMIANPDSAILQIMKARI